LTLQRLYYHELRSRFALSSQMAVRCLARVAGTYRRDKTICPTFRPDAAMPYDQRIMRFDGLDHVSLLTLAGFEELGGLLNVVRARRHRETQGDREGGKDF